MELSVFIYNPTMKIIDRLYVDTYGNFAPRVHKEDYKMLGKKYVYCQDCDCYSLGVGQIIRKHKASTKHALNVFLTEWLEYSNRDRIVFHVVDEWEDEEPKKVMIIEPCVQK
jgi:uncharacterized protein YqiB (DUF1249 family)